MYAYGNGTIFIVYVFPYVIIYCSKTYFHLQLNKHNIFVDKGLCCVLLRVFLWYGVKSSV